MDKTLFNLLNTGAPAATLVVRLLAGLLFFAEGIKKFMFPTEWGIGRFEKIGIIYPHLSAPFVGVVETVCGLLLIFGLFTQPAALLLLIDISVAILTTKVPLALHKGFWPSVRKILTPELLPSPSDELALQRPILGAALRGTPSRLLAEE